MLSFELKPFEANSKLKTKNSKLKNPLPLSLFGKPHLTGNCDRIFRLAKLALRSDEC
jgi:hypothetical protein